MFANMIKRIALVTMLELCAASGSIAAQAPAKVDFARDIQPLFKEHCVSCHGPAQQMNGFRLDQRRFSMTNRVGANGARIVPGKSAASRLYQRISGSAAGVQMPPTGALSDQQIAIVKAWIDQGAEWPDELSGEMVNSAPATPLMKAALYGNVQAVRTLVENGADPNAKNGSGATALMWAVEDAEKTRLLLDHGSDVNARSDDGRTALIIAAGRIGSAPVLRLLLDHGANPSDKVPAGGLTPLAEAARAGAGSTVRLLVERGADVKSAGVAALAAALRSDCALCIEILLPLMDSKAVSEAMVSAQSIPTEDTNKIRLLLDHGADVNAKDGTGRTTLMWAAYSDYVPAETVKLLIDRGADVNAKSRQDETALSFAAERGRTEPVRLLLDAKAVPESAPKPVNKKPAPAASVRQAVERSIPLLQRVDVIFLEKAGCVSCHNNSLTAMSIATLRKTGFSFNQQTAQSQLKAIGNYIESWRERLLQGIGIPGGPDTVSYILMGMAAENYPSDEATDAMARYLKMHQSSNGRWAIATQRPPIESSDFELTAVSMRALQVYAPKAQQAEYAKAVQVAANWLSAAQPRTGEDRAFQLLGLSWSHTKRETIQKYARELLAQQHPDGGWSQLPTLESDAYATGQALVALKEAGSLTIADPAYKRGVKFLLDSQFEDGSWFVKSRVVKIQPYFESGFPFGSDQWISAAATNWAVMALAPAAH
jgi:ankyrin repeat protein